MTDDAQAPASRAERLPKRFYTEVTLVEGPGGLGIALDGRAVRTPARKPLAVADPGLAEDVAAEWAGQGERIDPLTMPLTGLVNSAIDRVAPHAEAVRADIVAYAASDLLCYRAETPDALAARQTAEWDPILAWAEAELGARFALAAGIVHVEQPRRALAAVEAALAPLPALELAAVHVATTLTGSAVIALALRCRAVDADAAWVAAHVDEDWQAEQWGQDAEAISRRRARRMNFDAAARVLASPSAAG